MFEFAVGLSKFEIMCEMPPRILIPTASDWDPPLITEKYRFAPLSLAVSQRERAVIIMKISVFSARRQKGGEDAHRPQIAPKGSQALYEPG